MIADFRGMRCNDDRALTSESLSLLRKRILDAMVPVQPACKLTKPLPTLKQAYHAHKVMLQALDNALFRGFHHSALKLFWVDRPPKPLQPNQQRYLV